MTFKDIKHKALSIYGKRFIKPFNSPHTCPAWLFFEAIKNADSRYILMTKQTGEYPDWYPVPDIELEKLSDWFSDATGQTESKMFGRLWDSCFELRKRYAVLLAACIVLKIHKNEEIISLLTQLGIKIDVSSDEKYIKSLISLENNIKQLKIKLQIKTKEISSRFGSDKKAEFNYLSTITDLSKYYRFGIQAYKITLAEYVNLINNYRKSLDNGKR